MKTSTYLCMGILLSISLTHCCKQPTAAALPASAPDPLPSWSDGVVKAQIIEFVSAVVDSGNDSFVPVSQRLATFDFDGTIACEKPTYMEVQVAMDHLCWLAKQDPRLLKDSMYAAACALDYAYIDQDDVVYTALEQAFLGVDQDVYIDSVKAITGSLVNERLHRHLSELYYQPMLELIDFLQGNQFEVVLVSGSETGFLRGYGEAYLGIDAEKVIGSSMALAYQLDHDSSRFVRLDSYVQPLADGEGKAELINYRFSQQPILAFGNTMGDFEMLQFATSNPYPHLGMILVHDSPQEYVYHDSALEANAKRYGWLSVGMQENFDAIFATPARPPR